MTRPDSAMRLISLLEAEEKAVLSGDYAVLSQLATTRIELARNLETEQPDETTLRRISQMTQRNSSLLRAATEGIDDARKILNRLKKSAITEVYDRDGAKHRMPVLHSGLERKI